MMPAFVRALFIAASQWIRCCSADAHRFGDLSIPLGAKGGTRYVIVALERRSPSERTRILIPLAVNAGVIIIYSILLF